MDLPTWSLLILLLLMLFLSGCFSGSETAMIALDRYRLRHLAQQGNRAAILAENFLKTPDQVLSLILLGNNFVNIFASTLMTLIALRLGSDFAIAIGTGLLTFSLLIFSELAPKTFAAKHPEKVAFIAIYPLVALHKILLPITQLTNWLANNFLKLVGLSQQNVDPMLNREQLRTLLVSNTSNLDTKLSRMLANLLEFEDYRVDQIMVPLHEVVGIDMLSDEESILSLLRSSPYNRLPVYEDNLDHLIGILHVRDVLSSLNQFSKSNLWKLTTPAYFVPESAHLNAQLEQFRQEKQSMAMVVDEYGEITGLLTISDILEELVGRYTSNISDQVSTAQQRPDGSLIVTGSYSLKDLHNDHDIQLVSSNSTSINGFLIELIGSLPEGLCCTDYANYRFEITQLDSDRIMELIITTVEHDSAVSESDSQQST